MTFKEILERLPEDFSPREIWDNYQTADDVVATSFYLHAETSNGPNALIRIFKSRAEFVEFMSCLIFEEAITHDLEFYKDDDWLAIFNIKVTLYLEMTAGDWNWNLEKCNYFVDTYDRSEFMDGFHVLEFGPVSNLMLISQEDFENCRKIKTYYKDEAKAADSLKEVTDDDLEVGEKPLELADKSNAVENRLFDGPSFLGKLLENAPVVHDELKNISVSQHAILRAFASYSQLSPKQNEAVFYKFLKNGLTW